MEVNLEATGNALIVRYHGVGDAKKKPYRPNILSLKLDVGWEGIWTAVLHAFEALTGEYAEPDAVAKWAKQNGTWGNVRETMKELCHQSLLIECDDPYWPYKRQEIRVAYAILDAVAAAEGEFKEGLVP